MREIPIVKFFYTIYVTLILELKLIFSYSSADSRSRPTSPQAKRPPSRVSNEKLSLSKTKHRKGKVEPMASLRLTTSSDTSQEQDDQQQPILPALSSSSPLKKKPLKRIRRPRKASAGIPTPKTWNLKLYLENERRYKMQIQIMKSQVKHVPGVPTIFGQ